MRRAFFRAAALAICLAVPASLAHAQATILIVNGDPAGAGFNDPTPAAPVGGNTGTTVGAQRLIAFQRAADIWGQTLASATPIYVLASRFIRRTKGGPRMPTARSTCCSAT
jgi:hypothetical protein